MILCVRPNWRESTFTRAQIRVKVDENRYEIGKYGSEIGLKKWRKQARYNKRSPFCLCSSLRSSCSISCATNTRQINLRCLSRLSFFSHSLREQVEGRIYSYKVKCTSISGTLHSLRYICISHGYFVNHTHTIKAGTEVYLSLYAEKVPELVRHMLITQDNPYACLATFFFWPEYPSDTSLSTAIHYPRSESNLVLAFCDPWHLVLSKPLFTYALSCRKKAKKAQGSTFSRTLWHWINLPCCLTPSSYFQ